MPRSGLPASKCARTASRDRKSTRLNSSHLGIPYSGFCLEKKWEGGRKQRARHKGAACGPCGAELTEQKVRREPMRLTRLVMPVLHNWNFNSSPNKTDYFM